MLMNPIVENIGPAGYNAPLAFLVPMGQLPELVVSTLVFSIIGLLLFALAFWILWTQRTPYPGLRTSEPVRAPQLVRADQT